MNGTNLRDIRRQSKLGKEEFANRLGLKRTVLDAMEHGDRAIPAKVALAARMVPSE